MLAELYNKSIRNRRLPLPDAAEAHVLGEKGGIGKILLLAQVLNSDFFTVRSVDLKLAHIIVGPGSIALGFIVTTSRLIGTYLDRDL
jgi:hypothetical protein